MAVGDAIDSNLPNYMIRFRARNYSAELMAHSLPRFPVDAHPLSSTPASLQVHVSDEEKGDALDPLTAQDNNINVRFEDSEDSQIASKPETSDRNSRELVVKEWTTFKRFLVQKYPASKMVSVSPIADVLIGKPKVHEKSPSLHLDALDDLQGSSDEDTKFITQQEYVARLTDMKSHIVSAWHADDHVQSLKLSVKVARLLRDTTVLQFYPTLFSLVTDVLDMLGSMVWERIKRKAEFSEDGLCICSLPEDFEASDVCSEAKDTCHNWFCKIGSIRELLPRIYLELAILPCWRFLQDGSADVLQRLVTMMHGLGNPLASAYCHLYFVYCAQKMTAYDKGCLVTCIRDIGLMMMPIISPMETADDKSCARKQILVSLMEPPVEYIMKCILKDPDQANKIFMELGLGRDQSQLHGKASCNSVILHHLLKELPPDVVISNAIDMLDLIEGSSDASFDQYMNFRLLGFRLYEKDASVDLVNIILDRMIQVVSRYQNLDAYLKVVEGYVDILLQNQMTSQLEALLEGIADRACTKWIIDSELESLQSIFVKILTQKNRLEDIIELNHFVEILHIMRGHSRRVIDIHILEMATRNDYICCPTTIQFVFQVCQDLHDGLDLSNMLDIDNVHLGHLLSRFVQMVDFGTEWDLYLTFLVECRGAFPSADELKETLVHQGNCIAIKALQDAKQRFSFVRSCVAFCEATIPSISSPLKQLILYVETAEVALSSGLICHSDGLIDSAMSCIQSLAVFDESRVSLHVERITSIIRKLCALLIMIPGNQRSGVIYVPKSLLSFVNSESRWITTRLKVKTLCAVLSLLAALAQNKLPYHACGLEEVPGNDHLYFKDPSYHEELTLLCGCILQNVVPTVKQEASPVARGSLALEACNCIAVFLQMNDSISHICDELMEIAKSSRSSPQNYLLSTSTLLAKQRLVAQRCSVTSS